MLGAARIAPFALFKHARQMRGVDVVALAETYQAPSRALAYAKKHGIPTLHGSFEQLLADPAIDAVYVPLPISVHSQWTLAAIAAGKHVLCEKSLAANSVQAAAVHRAAAAKPKLVVCEAMHMLYHPLVERMRSLIAAGEIGELRHVSASFSAFIPNNDFRFSYALAGGCTIDMGCYPIAFMQAVTGQQLRVEKARAGLHNRQIDRWMRATMRFDAGSSVDLYVGMRSSRLLSVSSKFVGSHGSLNVLNFIKPEVYHRLSITRRGKTTVEQVPGGSTYAAQLAAFVAAIKTGTPIKTSTAEALKTINVIEAIYEKAGLPVRGLGVRG